MTIRTALIATVRLLKEVAALRAERREPPPRGGPLDRFELGQRAGGGASGGASGAADRDSGGGNPKGGTQVEFGQ
ncbi:MAG TPA: hypothetical protein VFB81_02780 [Myxococcales bacterium]|nr:hypothetical protein [Myxococcales bacterium]